MFKSISFLISVSQKRISLYSFQQSRSIFQQASLFVSTEATTASVKKLLFETSMFQKQKLTKEQT